MLTKEQIMCNSILKLAILMTFTSSVFFRHVDGNEVEINKERDLVKEFNAWVGTIKGDYSYDLIREFVHYHDDYLVLARLRTDPVALEAFVVVNRESSDYLYISSEYERKISCTTTNTLLDLDIVSDKRLSEIQDLGLETHPYYTLIEKNVDGVKNTFSFSSYYNNSLRREVDSLESYLLRSMLNNCPSLSFE